MNTSPYNNIPDRNIDHELMQRARALHEQACAHVDARTRARLAAARREALAARDHHRSHRVLWLPAAGAVAACALVLGVMWFRPQPANSPPQMQAQVATNDAELPLDADSQQIDLYQNLDFYQWLAQQPQAQNQPRGDGQ